MDEARKEKTKIEEDNCRLQDTNRALLLEVDPLWTLYGTLWTPMDPLWTLMDPYGPPTMDPMDPLWTPMDPYGPPYLRSRDIT